VRNRIAVAFKWSWDYVTFQRGVRLITTADPDERGEACAQVSNQLQAQRRHSSRTISIAVKPVIKYPFSIPQQRHSALMPKPQAHLRSVNQLSESGGWSVASARMCDPTNMLPDANRPMPVLVLSALLIAIALALGAAWLL
jgi:hypothetical protein